MNNENENPGRSCLKCHHVNPDANGGFEEACPRCGAIYSKVEMTLKTQQSTFLINHLLRNTLADTPEVRKMKHNADLINPKALALSPQQLAAILAMTPQPVTAKKSGMGILGWTAFFLIMFFVLWSTRAMVSHSLESNTRLQTQKQLARQAFMTTGEMLKDHKSREAGSTYNTDENE